MFASYPAPRSDAGAVAEAETALYEAAVAAPSGRPAAGPFADWPIRILNHFAPGGADLIADHAIAIDQVAGHILAAGRTGQRVQKVRLIGHSDDIGNPSGARVTAAQRARAVLDRLRLRLDQLRPGLAASIRFVPEQRGSTAPVATNRMEAGRALNRRVEVVLSFA